jgi:hypothetical protein
MNQAGKIVLSGVGGTTMMSAYSYWMSLRKGKDFREPSLLASLVGKRKRSYDKAAGWIIHYAVGVFFTAIYSRLWKKVSPLKSSPLIGLITGFIAVGGWEASLRLHPFHPFIDKKAFYMQLVIAHVVFCVSTALIYQAQGKPGASSEKES